MSAPETNQSDDVPSGDGRACASSSSQSAGSEQSGAEKDRLIEINLDPELAAKPLAS